MNTRDLFSRLRRQSALGVTLIFVLSTMIALGATIMLPAKTSHAVTGAGFTTVNEAVDGTGHCKNGNPNVNCNIYDGKQYVWLNGGPGVAYVGNGTYFFAVLVPGGQADPNDGAAKNLSSPNDAYTDRTFSVSGGTVSYSGPHDFNNNKIRLMPYDDTTNPGGVYILAICSLGPNGTTYPVDPSKCKYDAFKIEQGQVQPGKPLTITKDANGSETNTFTWTIQKDVDHTKVVDSSGSATFNYTVTVSHDGGTISNVKVTGTISVFNPNVDSSNNTVPVTIDSVTDQLSDGTNCSVTNGGNQTLTQFQTDFAYTCTLSALPSGKLNNTASVNWSQQLLDNGALLDAGSANFIFVNGGIGIIFAETKVDDCVNVTDDLEGNLGQACVGGANPSTFTYSHTVAGTPGTCVSQDNTATFTTNTTGATGLASKSVQMCTPEDLEVTKNSTPGFTRTYNWLIAKSASKTLIEQLGGGTATVTYTVTVKQSGSTDSGWQAAGSITLTNPNDFFDLTGVKVTDAVDDGGTCTVSGGTNVTVLAGKSVTLSYSCTYSSQPAYNTTATNTATATWDASFKTKDTSGSGQATFTFNDESSGNPSEVNKCVTITDSFGGQLGTDCVGTDLATKPFTYTRTFSVPTNNCVTYPNTATIKETGQTASASVEVCGPAKTGALTMGFWQNPNGQKIITGGASIGSVCNSGTWLRGYAPFQDLSATATCSQVGTYVINVIKAATCSGTTMPCNAMLKAQMLATALDVYFSDPALGGNKISAPAPIGGVKIDLTMICKMIDSSSGGSCSGSFENVSSAFGGATSMTVSDMLTYAASKSNAGGSTWYGNVKATQVLAKDAFDAINNQVAFAP